MRKSKILTLLAVTVMFLPFSASAYCSQGGECGCGDSVPNDTVLNSSIDACRGQGLEINSNDVTLNCQGHRITGATNRSSGIVAEDVDNVTVRNCNVSNYYSGIQLDNVSNPILVDNAANSNYAAGIDLLNVTGGLIRGNEFNSNWDGIYLEDSTGNRIVNNSAHRNGIDGIHLFYGSTGNEVYGNNLTSNKGHGLAPAVCSNQIGENNIAGLGKPIKYVEDRENVRIEDTSQYSEIIFCNVNDSVISNVTIKNGPLNTDGIILVDSDGNRVVDSYFEDVRTGIYLFRNSNLNKVLNNTVISSDLGTRLRYSSKDNLVAGNTIRTTGVYIKAVRNSSGNEFRHNLIEGRNITVNYTQDLELMYSKSSLNFTESGTVLREGKENSGLMPFLLILLVLMVLPLVYLYVKRSGFGVFSY
jgi:parallel beta-helix repeat protein